MSDYKVIGIHNTTGSEKLLDLASESMWKLEQFTIPSGSSHDALNLVLADIHSVDCIITVWNNTENKAKSLNLKIIKTSTGLKEVVTSKTGDVINLVVTPTIDGSIMKAVISTSESYDLSVDIAYIVLG